MLTLNTNIPNLIGRCFFLPLSVFGVYVFIRISREQPNINHIVFWEFRVVHLIYFIVLMFVFLIVLILCSLFSVIKVQIDKTADTITLISLLNSRTIALSNVENYFVTIHRNAFKKWKGLLLQCTDGNTIQLAGQNLKSIGALEQYLVDKGVDCLGDRKMKFPFY
jgi:hypothetical protein